MTLQWIEQGTPEWLELRANYIGSSEIAGLFALQAPFGMSEFTLHQVKCGAIPAPPVDDTPGSRVWMGKRLEPVIAGMAAEMYGWNITYPGPFAIDDECEGMSASLDGIIRVPGVREREMNFTGPGVLEVKRVEWLAHKRAWENGEPPQHIVLQAQHAMACSGMSWGVIVALAGEHGLIAYRYAAATDVHRILRAKVESFWSNIRHGMSPRPDHTASTAAALKALFPSLVDDETLDLTADDEIDIACARWLEAKDKHKIAGQIVAGYRNAIMFGLKGAIRAETAGHYIDAKPDKNGKVTLRSHVKP